VSFVELAMKTIHTRLTMIACLALGMMGGLLLRSFPEASWAEDPRPVRTAVAEPRRTPMTAAEHLQRAAEHLEAAGETGLAQHVRQLTGRPERLSYSNGSPLYGGLQVEPPARLPSAVPESPRWRQQYSLPPELDDGHMRFVQPARSQSETRESRTVPAPQRDPI
jgi:hypothetical protein